LPTPIPTIAPSITPTPTDYITAWNELPTVDGSGPIIYSLGTAEQLLSLATDGCSRTSIVACNASFKLSADVDFSGAVMHPIGSFDGSFDGQNHKIQNVIITPEIVEDGGITRLYWDVSNLGSGTFISYEIVYGMIDGIFDGSCSTNQAYPLVIDATTVGWNDGDWSSGVVEYTLNKMKAPPCFFQIKATDNLFSEFVISDGQISASYDDLSADTVGLFSVITGTVLNLEITAVDVSGENQVGILAGSILGTSESASAIVRSITITDSTARGLEDVGGVGGYAEHAILEDVTTSVDLSGTTDVGGLLGNGMYVAINGSQASGDIVASTYAAGGLLGVSILSVIEKSFFESGNVYGGYDAGGLVGWNTFSSIINCYSRGDVSGTFSVGGITGDNSSLGQIENSYATGNISGQYKVGGISGGASVTSTIQNTFAIGTVSCSTECGGLLGQQKGTLTNNYRYFNHAEDNPLATASSLDGSYNSQLSNYYSPNTSFGMSWSTDAWTFSTETFPLLIQPVD